MVSGFGQPRNTSEYTAEELAEVRSTAKLGHQYTCLKFGSAVGSAGQAGFLLTGLALLVAALALLASLVLVRDYKMVRFLAGSKGVNSWVDNVARIQRDLVPFPIAVVARSEHPNVKRVCFQILNIRTGDWTNLDGGPCRVTWTDSKRIVPDTLHLDNRGKGCCSLGACGPQMHIICSPVSSVLEENKHRNLLSRVKDFVFACAFDALMSEDRLLIDPQEFFVCVRKGFQRLSLAGRNVDHVISVLACCFPGIVSESEVINTELDQIVRLGVSVFEFGPLLKRKVRVDGSGDAYSNRRPKHALLKRNAELFKSVKVLAYLALFGAGIATCRRRWFAEGATGTYGWVLGIIAIQLAVFLLCCLVFG
jgi:hypothetical protein